MTVIDVPGTEDVADTRVKECDRPAACAQNPRAMGSTVHTGGPDRIGIHPGTPKPTATATHGDHRTVMSFAVAGLRTPGPTYDDPGCVRETFPEFPRGVPGLRRGPASLTPGPDAPANARPTGTRCPRAQPERQQWGA